MKPGYQIYPDSKLLELIALNDEYAFEEIYKRYAPEMFRTALRILRHQEGAEDAVQEVFVSIWRRRSELGIQQSLGGYLNQSIRYYVLRAYQQQMRGAAFQERLRLATEDILQDDPVLYRDVHRSLRQVINGLPGDQQLIFRLSRDYHMTYNEIARHLNISIKTVEKKMSQALRAIRPQMDRFMLWLITCLCPWVPDNPVWF